MFDLLLPLAIIAGLVIAAWKTGWLSTAVITAADGATRAQAWVTEEGRGAWIALTSRLLYRDFYLDTFEMADGWLWSGIETMPLHTDGWSNADTNHFSRQLNRIVVSFGTGVRVQTITKRTDDVSASIAVYERMAASALDPASAALLLGRAERIRRAAARGEAHATRQFVFFGKQAPRNAKKRFSWRAFLFPDPWLDQAEADFVAHREQVRMLRDSFMDQWREIGGASRVLAGEEVRDQVCRAINPVRALVYNQPAPRYDGRTNPREQLAMTGAEIKNSIVKWGGRPHLTVSLASLPQQTNARSMERLTRSATIKFPFDISTHIESLDTLKEEDKLVKEQETIEKSLNQSTRTNRAEQRKGAQNVLVQDMLAQGTERLVNIGFSVTFSADTELELEKRAEMMLNSIRKVHHMEAAADRHAVMGQHLSTLPGHVTTDVRRKRALSREAMALSCWTNGPAGLPPEEATMALPCADASLYHFDPRSPRFNAGMALACGPTGTGKSTVIAFLSHHQIASGVSGVFFDLNGTYYRLVVSLCGPEAHIRVLDPRRGIGRFIFDILPRPDERFDPEELNEAGVPLARLAQVFRIVEQLCIDPESDETHLAPELRAHLQRGVERAYYNKMGEVPTLDYIRRTIKLTRTESDDVNPTTRNYGQELYDRLAVFAGDGPLGRFFSAQGEFAPLDLPVVAFDFYGANKDPRLMQIATLAIDAYLDRFGAKHHPRGSFFVADELQELTRYPVLTVAIDSLIRTARKNQMHVTVGSQHPEDFEKPLLKAISINCETKWLFPMPPELAQRVFGLTVGQAKLIGRLEAGGREFRDVALISPLGAAHIRLRLNAADLRVCAAGTTDGAEPATLEAAYDAIPCEVPAELHRAFTVDRLGRTGSAAPSPETAAPVLAHADAELAAV